jgi:hypothetical protein
MPPRTTVAEIAIAVGVSAPLNFMMPRSKSDMVISKKGIVFLYYHSKIAEIFAPVRWEFSIPITYLILINLDWAGSLEFKIQLL